MHKYKKNIEMRKKARRYNIKTYKTTIKMNE